MARMTALDFVTDVRQMIGNPTTDEISNNQLLRCVNKAAEELVAVKPSMFKELETYTTVSVSAAGGDEYELSVNNILEPRSVRNQDTSKVIRYMDRKRLDSLRQGGSSSGEQPFRYCWTGSGANNRPNITFWPSISSSYTIEIRYIQIVPEVVLSPAPTSFLTSPRHDMAIFERAKIIAAGYIKHLRDMRFVTARAEDAESRAKGGNRNTVQGIREFETKVARETRID